MLWYGSRAVDIIKRTADWIRRDKYRKAGIMDLKDYREFAEKARTAYFATIDGDQPRVRPIDIWFTDEKGFYFFTQTV